MHQEDRYRERECRFHRRAWGRRARGICFAGALMLGVSSLALEAAQAAEYHEAPMLAELVKAGKLPPVNERVPENPRVITPVEEVGQYGGTWRSGLVGGS